MRLKIFYTFLAMLVVFCHIAFGQAYQEAPQNGFNRLPVDSREAQWLLAKYKQSTSAASNSYVSITPLEMDDFFDIDSMSEEHLNLAKKLIREGKVVAIDSTVGNASRLGNPPGGKGAVAIAENLTFLEMKIMRLAVESYLVGAPIPQVLWTSDENKESTIAIISGMNEKIQASKYVSPKVKEALALYLGRDNITLMAQADLLPVINSNGELTTDHMRNLGAGEAIPTLYRSKASTRVGLTSDSIVIFSNIDFDLSYVEMVAASEAAGRPDVMPLHVKADGFSGGSAYRVIDRNGREMVVGLEDIEVPVELQQNKVSFNTNTVVLRGKALNPEYYDELGIPFEKKSYILRDSRGLPIIKDGVEEKVVYYLPKVSLLDISKHQEVATKVAITHNIRHYFFPGSKDSALLEKTGPMELLRRVNRFANLLGDEVAQESVLDLLSKSVQTQQKHRSCRRSITILMTGK